MRNFQLSWPVLAAITLLTLGCQETVPKSETPHSSFNIKSDLPQLSIKIEEGDTLLIEADLGVCMSTYFEKSILFKKNRKILISTTLHNESDPPVAIPQVEYLSLPDDTSNFENLFVQLIQDSVERKSINSTFLKVTFLQDTLCFYSDGLSYHMNRSAHYFSIMNRLHPELRGYGPIDVPPAMKEETSQVRLLDSSYSVFPTLNSWLKHYQPEEHSLKLSQFTLNSSSQLQAIPGNIFGNFDTRFDTRFEDVLIYNSDNSAYIDLDSYCWIFNDSGELSSSPDQAINWVDIPSQTVTRIAFRGPESWIEDAFWKSDSVVVLLGSSYENILWITEINLEDGIIHSYNNSTPSNVKSSYTIERLKRVGLMN